MRVTWNLELGSRSRASVTALHDVCWHMSRKGQFAAAMQFRIHTKGRHLLQLNDASRAAVVSDIRQNYPEGDIHLNEVPWDAETAIKRECACKGVLTVYAGEATIFCFWTQLHHLLVGTPMGSGTSAGSGRV